ncbi:MAG: ABC transporter ATP-binding protein, partial [Arthrobacter sp.]|nr:ABC transporter ATP-binding protein [Arthrobacter sp.]
MLLTLIKRYSKPYLGQILAVLLFQLGSTIAALYLPSLNAQIIDQGVSKGDTDYIWRTGSVMLMVAFI